jgi:hypothetical protein
MTNAATKTFDTVEMVRAVRDELSTRITTMSADEENRWLRSTELSDPTLRRLMDLAARGHASNEKKDPDV